MTQQKRSTRFLQQRRFLMILPLLVVPFITCLFWILGGGSPVKEKRGKRSNGINMELPEASLETNSALNKLSYYRLARRDSNRRKKQMKRDPNYQKNRSPEQISKPETGKRVPSSAENKSTEIAKRNEDDNPRIASLYQKLDALDAVLEHPAAPPAPPDQAVKSTVNREKEAAVSSADIDKLEQMMQKMNQPGGNDPEMQQLNSMLEKIIHIQHPEQMAQKLKAASREKRGQVLAVTAGKEKVAVSSFGGDSLRDRDMQSASGENGFYALTKQRFTDQQPNTIWAVVHKTQRLVSGATVKLRLLDDCYINGVRIPKGHFVFGTASLSEERLQVEIQNIRYERSLFPVSLSVYDLDGMKGIYVPGAITRKAAKQAAGNATQSIGLTTFDPSLGARAAGAGIEAAKKLINKKVKRISVTIKAGYKVLLKNEK